MQPETQQQQLRGKEYWMGVVARSIDSGGGNPLVQTYLRVLIEEAEGETTATRMAEQSGNQILGVGIFVESGGGSRGGGERFWKRQRAA